MRVVKKGGQIRCTNILEATNINSEFRRVQWDANLNPGVYPFVIQYELHGAGKKVKAGEITLVR